MSGPIEILCKEIGFDFDRRMETPALLVGFVSELVAQIADMRRSDDTIAKMVDVERPSADSAEALRRVNEMLASNDTDSLIAKAADIHTFIHTVAPDEKHPCDHLIDMLSSCVSAIRFGLETPCNSRHAAAAAQHIWGRRYGITLFDRFTPNWEREWARAHLQRAILATAFPGGGVTGKGEGEK